MLGHTTLGSALTAQRRGAPGQPRLSGVVDTLARLDGPERGGGGGRGGMLDQTR